MCDSNPIVSARKDSTNLGLGQGTNFDASFDECSCFRFVLHTQQVISWTLLVFIFVAVDQLVMPDTQRVP